MFAANWDGNIALGVSIGNKNKLTVMSGPCMLESLELGLKVGTFLKEKCAAANLQYIFKSSFDKANRTSHNTARGPGLEKGLEHLAEIRKTLNVPVLTDIHTPHQAKKAATVCDILQIPAFLCEQRELLIAAAETGKTIQIKKGQHTGPEDVVKVAEFLNHLGYNKVILCERGTTFGYNNLVVDFRNLIEMKKKNHAVVFDATHAVQLPGAGAGVSSGLRHMIPALTRAAIAVGIDGLFMEVHENPDKALSDAATQLPFSTAEEIISFASKYQKNCYS